MAGDFGESELAEHRLDGPRRRRGELDELEAHESHRVLEQVGHGVAPGYGADYAETRAGKQSGGIPAAVLR